MELEAQEKRKSFFESAATWGLVYGLTMVVYTATFNILEYYPFSIPHILVRLVLISLGCALFFSIYPTIEYRNNQMKGIIKYGNALLYGTLIFFFASLFSSLFDFIWSKFIDPQIYDNMAEGFRTYIASVPGLTDAQRSAYADKATEIQQLKDIPVKTLFKSIGSMTTMGFLLMLIVAAFIRREEAPFSNEELTES